MHRLLLIESSPTLRRGIEQLLCCHGFEVVAVAACAQAVPTLEGELGRGLTGVLLGWSTAPDAVVVALSQRLRASDCAALAVLVLAADPRLVDPGLSHHRPRTLVKKLHRPSEVPRWLRSLLAPSVRDPRAANGPTALKVLLVDDSRTSRTKYQRLLKAHSYAVVTCEHGHAALAKVEDERFDLAIVDYHMPVMNGAMLCRALRERPAARETTLAVLTGTYEEGLISDCLEAGAAECMFKNESDELFLARVHGMAQLRERERRLRDESLRLELILDSVGDGVYGVDREGRVTFVNPAALRLLHCSHEDELVGLLAHARIHGKDERGRAVASETCFLQQAYELGDSLSNWETVFWRADGEPIHVECTVRPQHKDGACVGVVVAFRDIAERKRMEAEMEWQLRHDHLTKLHNRRYFEDMLEQEIMRLRRSAEQSALLFIDLDRFKHINDTAGHAAGDALLASIGHKLKARSRQSDLVARLAGDEFAVLLRHVDDGKVAAMAEKFRAILDETRFVHDGREFEVSGSVGICHLNRHTLSPAYAMNCADAACQIAKRQGRNRCHRFDFAGDAGALAALQQSWSLRLAQALSCDHFALQFQPIVDLRSVGAAALDGADWRNHLDQALPAALHGHEVFVRLDDMDSRLPPRAFLAQAERFDLLPALDTWVLERLAAHAVQGALGPAGCLHVNLAVVSLLDAGYRERLVDLVEQGAFAAGQLCLELKESEAAGQMSLLAPLMQDLAQRGVRFVLDEYGRGLAGLGQLRALPLWAVKLDAQLVQGVAQDEFGVAVVRAMNELAHALGLVVIAPLVEDAPTLRLLRRAGADCAQGFALAAPDDRWSERALGEQTA